MDKIIAKVIKIDLDIYILCVVNTKEIITAKLRGNAKKKSNILVGDIVAVEKANEDYMITDVRNRKNSLIRPPVSNIDQMIIVISVGAPTPDYILLDKQIVLCLSKNIEPVICVNKIDLALEDKKANDDIEYVRKVYESLGIRVVFVSAKTAHGIDELKRILLGKTSAFSGNSGVGKTSITKEILGDETKLEIGNLGEKSRRGKHTTKAVSLYNIDENTYILDTPGFSSYELYDVEHKKLREFYPEFKDIVCDYDDCMHVLEKDDVCKVKANVKSGLIDSGRYERYVYIYSQLKERYDKRYK